ncbi:MAG TPA: Dickkopf N-terminal cysteine-rich domain-containing protein [Polyangia bacterium]|jgi:hypothetical protein|nr:Dickkopf N-terminal cysteine-rich domain-containing protein [Polyangia bacterium]
MHRRPPHAALVLFTALGVAGCDTPPLYESTSREQFFAQLPALYCAQAVRCGSIGSSEEASCRSRLAQSDALVSIPGYSYSEALQAGRLGFDGVAAAKCLAYYRAPRCSLDAENIDNYNACGRLYRPAVRDGGTCKINTECRSNICNAFGPPGCPGVCAATAGCNRLSCYEDEFCGSSGACALRGALGEPCDAQLGLDVCQAGLVCQGSTCSVPAKENDSCTAREQCAAGLFCDLTSNTCKPRLAIGDACASQESCQDGLLCTATTSPPTAGVCKPTLDFPSACDPDLATAPALCPVHAECDTNTRQCVERLAPGASCATESCQMIIFYCDESTLTCQEPLDPGATCTPPSSSDPTHNPCGASGQCDPATRKCVLACG